MKQTINVYGAGLAGCEAAWQAAKRGVKVRLFEMKPQKFTPAHHSEKFAELVCSNSLRSDSVTNAVGLLKEELRRMGSLIMEAADATRVPAGSALAVDRELFSDYITNKIKSCPDIEVIECEALSDMASGRKKGHSFPSRHVFSAFIIGTLWMILSPYVGAATLLFGAVIAISRVLLGIHFLRDVIVGAVIGVASGVIGILIW